MSGSFVIGLFVGVRVGGSVSSVAVLKGDFVGVAEGFAVGGAVGLFVTAKGLCVG